jgi:hypothetical protein
MRLKPTKLLLAPQEMGKHGLIVMKTLGLIIGRLGDVPVRRR